MKEHELHPPLGAKHPRKRVGRGTGSGHGKSAGRGNKGQNARSGGTKAPYFEGGQLPLVRRMPFKRGFVNIFRVPYSIVNVRDLERFAAGTTVTPAVMAEAGLIKTAMAPVKVLGEGDLGRSLSVHVHSCSGSAKAKIEAAGGTVVLLGTEQGALDG